MKKKHATLEEIDRADIARAKLFVVNLRIGPDEAYRVEAATEDEAFRESAKLEDRLRDRRYGRRALVYAVTPEGRQVFVSQKGK